MAKQSSIEQDGTIVEALSNAMFRVELQNRRKGKLYVINKKNPRYKQRQG
jgi:translation initiation factor IF-1